MLVHAARKYDEEDLAILNTRVVETEQKVSRQRQTVLRLKEWYGGSTAAEKELIRLEDTLKLLQKMVQ